MGSASAGIGWGDNPLDGAGRNYSHSIVAGGLLVIS